MDYLESLMATCSQVTHAEFAERSSTEQVWMLFFCVCELTCPGSYLWGSHCLFHTAMTISQRFLVQPSCSVRKGLIQSLYYLSSVPLGEVKNKGKFQNLVSKSGRVRLLERVAYKRFQIWWSDFKMFGILENWSLERGGHNQRFDFIL